MIEVFQSDIALRRGCLYQLFLIEINYPKDTNMPARVQKDTELFWHGPNLEK